MVQWPIIINRHLQVVRNVFISAIELQDLRISGHNGIIFHMNEWLMQREYQRNCIKTIRMEWYGEEIAEK